VIWERLLRIKFYHVFLPVRDVNRINPLTSSISLTWDGSYSDVYIQWNDTNLFTDTDESAFILENNYTITNLQSNTTYYRNNFFNTNTGRQQHPYRDIRRPTLRLICFYPDGRRGVRRSSITPVAGNMTYANGDYTVSASSQFNTTIWNPIRCLTQTRLTAGFPKRYLR
jgi:hypothetical protein